jgi:glycosyltransferase involved in cell wall biosynthesis
VLFFIEEGSRDATAVGVEARGDARITCVRTENGGVSVARNRGIERASGAYLAFLDADDAWQRPKLERQRAAMMEQPATGVLFTATQLVDDALRPVGLQPALQRSDWTEAILLEGNILPGSASSVMARRSVIEEAGGFDPALSLCADWDMWLRLSALTELGTLGEALTRYRTAPGTMSSNPVVLERDTFAMLDKFYASPGSAPYERLRRRVYASQWMVCAGSYLHTGHARDSLRCVRRAVRSDPRSLQRVVTMPARWARRARSAIRRQG